MTFGLLFGPQPCNPFCLGHKSKVKVVTVEGILGLPLWSPMTKCHMDVGFVERHKIYYKGEGGGFPQVWAMGIL